jgi:hypothetical protein
MNFTFQQKLTMGIGFVGAATSAFGALNPIMTSTEALIGTVIFGFVSACLAVVATVTSSQSSQIKNVVADPGAQEDLVKAVAAMTGVTRVAVNEQASPTLAAIATDPTQPKVGPATPDVRPTLVATAKAAS